MLDLNSTEFRDQLYGCWMGKNCGGTLGAPLEKIFGEPEPFDVWWYPELREGGIPNDDLEMQLVWLKALEEVGPRLKAAHLAQYWLDHIGYNWDEYGFSKTNLRLGLLPPVSGHYNNWFIDCMGCPIRSEIWASIAPGVPALAVRYAYEDAICDHAGGESVYGELFNAAVESAAFVVADRDELIKIGLSYIPANSKTALAIRTAVDAYVEGVDWQTARKRVLAATPHYNAQYSPPNIAFQVIGWLYGNDFGDAICKAVNCGYDTDCTGATLGSYLGIIASRQGLPEKWTAPLGENISTNESWGGLRHTSTGPNPVPTTLTELVERIIVQARRVLADHGLLENGSIVRVDPAQLYADESIQELWDASHHQITYPGQALNIAIDYINTPAVIPGEAKVLNILLTNPRPDSFTVNWHLNLPEHWRTTPANGSIEVPAFSTVTLVVTVEVPGAAFLENANRLFFVSEVVGCPQQPAVPVVLVGARQYQVSRFYPGTDQTDEDMFAQAYKPEQVATGESLFTPAARAGEWSTMYALEHALPLQTQLEERGVIYVRGFLWNPDADREVWMGIDTNGLAKLWVNDKLAVQYVEQSPIRPNYGGNKTKYAAVTLRQGWNEVLLKLVHTANGDAFAGHFLFSDGKNQVAGITTITHTRTPWDN